MIERPVAIQATEPSDLTAIEPTELYDSGPCGFVTAANDRKTRPSLSRRTITWLEPVSTPKEARP